MVRLGKTASARRWTALVALVSTLLIATPAVAQAAPPDDAQRCMDGRWRTLVDRGGQPFRNQGQCVSAAVRGELGEPLDPQVTGPFTGTTFFEFGVNDCEFVFQQFDLTYSTATGDGTVHLEGCVEVGAGFTYVGTFTLTSPSGGTMTGAVDGSIEGVIGGSLDFTLTAETTTGSLGGATGTVQLTGTWDTADTVSGTLTGQLSPG